MANKWHKLLYFVKIDEITKKVRIPDIDFRRFYLALADIFEPGGKLEHEICAADDVEIYPPGRLFSRAKRTDKFRCVPAHYICRNNIGSCSSQGAMLGAPEKAIKHCRIKEYMI